MPTDHVTFDFSCAAPVVTDVGAYIGTPLGLGEITRALLDRKLLISGSRSPNVRYSGRYWVRVPVGLRGEIRGLIESNGYQVVGERDAD